MSKNKTVNEMMQYKTINTRGDSYIMRKKVIIAALMLSMVTCLTACKNDKKADETNDLAVEETSSARGTTIDDALNYVTLGDYKGLTLSVAEVTDEDINNYIQTNLLDANVSYEQIKEGTIKNGDTVNINYVGKKDGVAFDGGTDDSEEGYNLEIGSGNFIPGFEEGLVGKKIGDTVDLDLTFPEDYQNEELKGQAVVFTVTINYVCGDEKKPELTDDFVASNTAYKTVAEYKDSVKEIINNQNVSIANQDVWNQVLEGATVSEYPEEDIKLTQTSMLNYYNSMAQSYGMELDDVLSTFGTTQETFNEDTRETAESIVKEKLVALAIAKTENLEISDELYNEKLETYAANYGYESAEAMEATVSKDEMMQQIYCELGMNYVMDNVVNE